MKKAKSKKTRPSGTEALQSIGNLQAKFSLEGGALQLRQRKEEVALIRAAVAELPAFISLFDEKKYGQVVRQREAMIKLAEILVKEQRASEDIDRLAADSEILSRSIDEFGATLEAEERRMESLHRKVRRNSKLSDY